MVILRISVRLLGLVSTIVLARLLMPDDFGLIAIAGSIVAILETASDFGFNNALIWSQRADRREYDTAWSLNVLRGIALGVLMYLSAPLLAGLLGDGRLEAILKVFAAIVAIEGVANIGVVDFQKELTFSREFVYRLIPKLAGVAVSISMAIAYQSYWALVGGLATSKLLTVVLSYLMHPFRGRFDLSAWRKLFSFSGWLMLSQVLRSLNERLEQFFLGAFISARATGFYHVGIELSTMAVNEITAPVQAALFPGLSKAGGDAPQQRQMFRIAEQSIAFITLPIGIGMGLVAEPFVQVVLGDKWADAVPVIQIFAPILALVSICSVHTSMLMARGRTELLFRVDLITLIARVLLLYFLVQSLGVIGAVIMKSVAALLWAVAIIFLTSRVLGESAAETFRSTWRSLVAVSVMAIAVGGTDLTIDILASGTGSAIRLLLLAVVGAFVYIMFHFLLWHVAGRPQGAERLLADLVADKIIGSHKAMNS